ncbi:MAG: glycosyltransferase family 8 protein [Ruminococcus flavefaciens]|nr:glycosyltransferase family 8 protein [Ruminococcus flavefaciens]
MNILYASDNNFSEIMGISILSLFENNKDVEDIRIYIVNDNISEDNCRKIESIFTKYNRTMPIWKAIRSINEVLKVEVYEDRFSQTQFARLFLEKIIDKNDERILYLDCDTIVHDSLKELWDMPLNGKMGAVLADAFSPLYRANIGLEKNDLMFNSGVMLIDMVKWREEFVGHQLRAFIRAHRGMVQQGDQGVLNAVLSKKVCVFSPRYNLVTNYSAFTYGDMMLYRKPVNIYSEEEIEEAKVEPCIIHYTSSFMVARPWENGAEHPYKKVWDYYKSISPWKEEIQKEKQMKRWKMAYVKLSEKVPYRVSLVCSGLLQAYVRPVYGRWKYRGVKVEE